MSLAQWQVRIPLRFIVVAFIVDYRGNVTLILRYHCFIAAILSNSWAIKYVVAPSQYLYFGCLFLSCLINTSISFVNTIAFGFYPSRGAPPGILKHVIQLDSGNTIRAGNLNVDDSVLGAARMLALAPFRMVERSVVGETFACLMC